jgi:hypothetical protein
MKKQKLLILIFFFLLLYKLYLNTIILSSNYDVFSPMYMDNYAVETCMYLLLNNNKQLIDLSTIQSTSVVMLNKLIGGFWMDVRLKITFRLRCACYTCNYLQRDNSRQGKFMKLLRIEIENYPIIMTMGMYRIEPPWISICLTGFRLLPQYWGRENGVLFLRWCISLKNWSYRPPIERQCKPFQKHVSSY